MAAERLARDLVTWGDVVRVIRRGTTARVRVDKGLWYHDLATPHADGPGDLDAFWAACRDEMSRIDRMHPLDEWSSAGGDGDTDLRDLTGMARRRHEPAEAGPTPGPVTAPPGGDGPLWDPSSHP
jgi:hypothetical protein